MFARHAGPQRAVFSTPVQRLVCAVASSGKRTLLTNAGGALDDNLCAAAAGGLEADHPPMFATTLRAAYVAHTEGATPNASGVVLFQTLDIPAGTAALSLPLRQYRPLPGACWPVVAMLFDAKRTLLHSQEVNVSTAAWVDLKLSAPPPAGRYHLELWPSPNGPGGVEQGIFTSSAWISTLVGDEDAASPRGGLRTYLPNTALGGDSTEVPPTLGSRMAAAMRWQLRYARQPDGSVGVLKIPDANW